MSNEIVTTAEKKAIWDNLVEGTFCPRKDCGARRVRLHGTKMTRFLAVCENGHRSSPFAGRGYRKPRIPLRKWLGVIRCYVKYRNQESCVSSLHLHKERGIPRTTCYRLIEQLEAIELLGDGEEIDRLDRLACVRRLWVSACKGDAIDKPSPELRERFRSPSLDRVPPDEQSASCESERGFEALLASFNLDSDWLTIGQLAELFAVYTGREWKISTHLRKLRWYNTNVRSSVHWMPTTGKRKTQDRPCIRVGAVFGYILFASTRWKPEMRISMRRLPRLYRILTCRKVTSATVRRKLDAFNRVYYQRETPRENTTRYLEFKCLPKYLAFCWRCHYQHVELYGSTDDLTDDENWDEDDEDDEDDDEDES